MRPLNWGLGGGVNYVRKLRIITVISMNSGAASSVEAAVYSNTEPAGNTSTLKSRVGCWSTTQNIFLGLVLLKQPVFLFRYVSALRNKTNLPWAILFCSPWYDSTSPTRVLKSLRRLSTPTKKDNTSSKFKWKKKRIMYLCKKPLGWTSLPYERGEAAPRRCATWGCWASLSSCCSTSECFFECFFEI